MSNVLIAGAGIIGLSAARALLAEGHSVTIVDRDPAGDKASFGNAGGLGVTEIVPASVPGLVWKVPGWLCDPLGPLSVRPAHFPKLVPWLARFMHSSSQSEMLRITKALAALTAPVYDDYMPLLEELKLTHELHQVGALWVYETEAAFKADAFDRDLRRSYGIVFDELDGYEARRLEPALGKAVVRAAMTPQWSHFDDPKRVVDRLREFVVAQGVKLVSGEAVAIESKQLRLATGKAVDFDQLIIATGAWSARLAKSIGDRVLLESERGYNITIPNSGVSLTREVIFAERKFVATPMDMGLRIGGAAEFAGLETAPNYARSNALAKLARIYLPDLKSEEGTRWMGHRPTTPDSLPVIGRSPHRDDVIHAYGHSHGGLTLGPTTARLIADLVARRQSAIDLSPFSVSRFS
ncbi:MULTISPECIES: NAD(P)/FAD-dependent oxidoreductase [Brucella/Ochrobactrum group]|jgi:D-amino-acid dehydrogenase|uniref:NAD(P)/FAD-dependent oxidoreductase n=1 Tax=Brucella/Ochrobactrum group TaxID=2826938 RepID=UPI001C05D9F4|nr:FAD-binding oxidoreductase [Brucella sp. NBRC 12950]QWK80958.1 FAD-binding oxidoreductase [Ochrobactrum sp. BTU1]GLU27386.1 amino acid dehydrogenase [Brucella sp. NBRC 12950]